MQAKKSLGQNFLLDETVGKRIVEALDPHTTDTIVEIGPGTGFLTAFLNETGAKIIAIEKDHDLIPGLLRKFPISSNVSIVEGDILDTRISKYCTEALRDTPPSPGTLTDSSDSLANGNPATPTKGGDQACWISNCPEEGGESLKRIPHKKKTPQTNDAVLKKSFKVVGNIPYYITAPIIRKLLAQTPAPQTIVLMVQKEVAERITAKPGDMSILTVATQYYATPEYLFTVPRTAFDPAPKVDSAVIRLVPHTPYDATQDKEFFRLVKIGFASRRKTLANNLAAGLRISKENAESMLQEARISRRARAQELGLEEWERLADIFTATR